MTPTATRAWRAVLLVGLVGILLGWATDRWYLANVRRIERERVLARLMPYANALRSAKGLDLRRIDDADLEAVVGQVGGHRLPVHAGGLHANVRIPGPMLGQPGAQLLKPDGRVGHHLRLPLACWQLQGQVQFGLGNIYADSVRIFLIHVRSTLYMRAPAKPGRKILSDLWTGREKGSGCRLIYLTGFEPEGWGRRAPAPLGFRRTLDNQGNTIQAVSYTHLTLPTSDLV